MFISFMDCNIDIVWKYIEIVIGTNHYLLITVLFCNEATFIHGLPKSKNNKFKFRKIDLFNILCFAKVVNQCCCYVIYISSVDVLFFFILIVHFNFIYNKTNNIIPWLISWQFIKLLITKSLLDICWVTNLSWYFLPIK